VLHRIGPFRTLVALLLAAWMPFCCCNLRSILSDCASCEADSGGKGPVGHRHDSGALHQHAAPMQSHQDGPQDQPTKGGHDHDKRACTCDHNKQTTIGIAKSTIDFPVPVLAYIQPYWEPTRSLQVLCAGPRSDALAHLKPPTSLLRQHCALIV
jgi:hypothetical protein